MSPDLLDFLRTLDATLRAAPPPAIRDIQTIVSFALQWAHSETTPPLPSAVTQTWPRDLHPMAQQLLALWRARRVTRPDLPPRLAAKATGIYYVAFSDWELMARLLHQTEEEDL